jgi:hypothetical protein
LVCAVCADALAVHLSDSQFDTGDGPAGIFIQFEYLESRLGPVGDGQRSRLAVLIAIGNPPLLP